MTVNIDRRTFLVVGLLGLASVVASAHAAHASPSDQDGGSDHGKGKGGSTKDHGGDHSDEDNHSDDHNDDHTHDDGHDSSSDHGGRGKGPKYRGGRNAAQQVKGRPGRSLEDQVLKAPHF